MADLRLIIDLNMKTIDVFTNSWLRRHTNVTMITCLMSKKIQLRSCGKPQYGLLLQKE